MNKLALGAILLGASIASANSQPEAVPGEYVVKLKDSAFEQEGFQLQNQLGIQIVRKVSAQSKAILVRDSVVRKAENVISALSANSAVEYVEPNYVYRANVVPNDTDFSKLWGMVNEGQVDPKGRQDQTVLTVIAEKPLNTVFSIVRECTGCGYTSCPPSPLF